MLVRRENAAEFAEFIASVPVARQVYAKSGNGKTIVLLAFDIDLTVQRIVFPAEVEIGCEGEAWRHPSASPRTFNKGSARVAWTAFLRLIALQPHATPSVCQIEGNGVSRTPPHGTDEAS